MAKTKLVHGVGILDADYRVVHRETVGYVNGKQIQVLIWECPIYTRWASMLMRCYCPKYKVKRPTYEGCAVCPEWLYFSNFRAWMIEQDWEGKQLDKDILVEGNKIYSPTTCMFVNLQVNYLLLDSAAMRGDSPIGVTFDKSRNKFKASVYIDGECKYLGRFESKFDAHKAWQKGKITAILEAMANESNLKVIEALQRRVDVLKLDLENGQETIKL